MYDDILPGSLAAPLEATLSRRPKLVTDLTFVVSSEHNFFSYHKPTKAQFR